ncbi:MAG: Hsp33 family molecular chaperone HslO [Defluviitaleaceae bacterium]|nr:Hsp33 family molecular chaperone HslO [Defluviitaleaceae bacterium]MCL2837056.1 Hsp33 family molecular chaperone HslO [Defluviitaleaceae bacterium]
MSDHILRITAANGAIRAFIADTRNTVNMARQIHDTRPVMSAALGRLLTAGAIMGLMLKNDGDLLTLTIKGDGPGGMVLVTADSAGNVKGYCNNPHADLPLNSIGKLDVSGILGAGTLTVIKDMGSGEPYNGAVALQTGEIAEDIAYYFAQSEQTPSVVSLGVLVDVDYSIKQAGGFIIQLMPGASDAVIDFLEQKVTGLASMTTLYEQGHTTESLAEMLFSESGYEILDKLPCRFACNCSRGRVEKALVAIGRDELENIAKQDKSASLNCHFCNKKYDFNEADINKLLKQ